MSEYLILSVEEVQRRSQQENVACTERDGGPPEIRFEDEITLDHI